MAISLRRDSQQWIFDRIVNETGKVFHFQGPGRGRLPASVKQHDMISKHVGRRGVHVLELAQQEEECGHKETALDLYFEAASAFASAQHPIFETNGEKRALHALSLLSFQKVRELAPYPIEHLEVPFDGGRLFANLHLLPDERPAPCVVVIPGCDMTKEMYPHPFANQAGQRGMHLVTMDGPGQGECNIAGVRMTAHNYPDAVTALVDYLTGRDEVASDQIVMLAVSFGTHWAIQTVGREHRIAACAAMWASICHKRHLLEEESPRYKQLFAYLTGVGSEAELDRLAADMGVDEVMGDIRCPTLLTVGEYDPRSPLSELYDLYDRMTCSRQLWVHEDQHHMASPSGRAAASEGALAGIDTWAFALDWLRDRLAGRPLAHDGEVLYVTSAGSGPNGSSARPARTWDSAYGLNRWLAGPTDRR